MYIGNGDFITLPNELETQERIELCEKIINENPWYFKYVLPKGTNDIIGKKVEMRLTIMANYILFSLKPIGDEKKMIPTNYKMKHRNYTEIPFSNFDNRQNYETQ